MSAWLHRIAVIGGAAAALWHQILPLVGAIPAVGPAVSLVSTVIGVSMTVVGVIEKGWPRAQ